MKFFSKMTLYTKESAHSKLINKNNNAWNLNIFYNVFRILKQKKSFKSNLKNF